MTVEDFPEVDSSHVHRYEPVAERRGGFEFITGWRCWCGVSSRSYPPALRLAKAGPVAQAMAALHLARHGSLSGWYSRPDVQHMLRAIEEDEMGPHYEVKEAQGDREEWYVRFVGANGETLWTSETFTRKADAERAVATYRREALEEATAFAREAEQDD